MSETAFRAIVLGAAMLPAAWPALRLYRGLGTAAGLALFTAGYLAVWVAAAGVLMLVMAPAGPLLAVAGVYQLGPLQAVSLRRCRAPLGLLVRRSGLRAGVEYAIACAGCCAGLMLALVALDMMMSVLWMTGLVYWSSPRRCCGTASSSVASQASPSSCSQSECCCDLVGLRHVPRVV